MADGTDDLSGRQQKLPFERFDCSAEILLKNSA